MNFSISDEPKINRMRKHRSPRRSGWTNQCIHVLPSGEKDQSMMLALRTQSSSYPSEKIVSLESSLDLILQGLENCFHISRDEILQWPGS